MTTTRYYATRDLCDRFRCSSRTLFRRMLRKHNPFPAPCIRHVGSCNLWDAEDVAAWEQRERLRTIAADKAAPTSQSRPAEDHV